MNWFKTSKGNRINLDKVEMIGSVFSGSNGRKFQVWFSQNSALLHEEDYEKLIKALGINTECETKNEKNTFS